MVRMGRDFAIRKQIYCGRLIIQSWHRTRVRGNISEYQHICITPGTDVLDKYLMHRQEREEKVWETMVQLQREKENGAVTAMEIAAKLYPNHSQSLPASVLERKQKQGEDNVLKVLRKFLKDGSARAWARPAQTQINNISSSRHRMPLCHPTYGVNDFRNLPALVQVDVPDYVRYLDRSLLWTANGSCGGFQSAAGASPNDGGNKNEQKMSRL